MRYNVVIIASLNPTHIGHVCNAHPPDFFSCNNLGRFETDDINHAHQYIDWATENYPSFGYIVQEAP